jgi:fumarate reductase flavoprotein subunit
VAKLRELVERSRQIGVRSSRDGPNPELVTAYRVQKMLKVALCMSSGALARTESRGAHFREDYPRRNDALWLKRTLATWRTPADTLPTLDYEPLDVMRMELPPGWRGYGGGLRRHLFSSRCRSRPCGKTERTDRYGVQAALMPTSTCCPLSAGRNERIDEKLLDAIRW